MRVFIHIGVPKTGTSAIQSHLSTNRKWLLDNGVYIPRAGFQTGQGHGLLLSRGDTETPPDALRPWLPEKGALPGLRREIEQASELSPHTILLSWEGFALLDSTLIQRLCDELAPYELELLCYVRNQHKLWSSQLSQSIKAGINRASQQLEYFAGAPIMGGDHLDFHSLLNRWSDAMGDRGRIRTRLYSRSLLAGEDIVTDLLDALGVEVSPGFSLQSEDVNESLDLASTAILALVEEAGIDGRQRHRLVRALVKASARGLPSRRPARITDASAAEADRALLASNEDLWRRFPPENVEREAFEKEMLQQPWSDDDTGDATLDLCRAALAAMQEVEPITWHGNMMRGHQLSDITWANGEGWRRSESKGIWSVGERSSISFRLPKLSPEHGPDTLRLIFSGRYFGRNQETRVRGHSIDQRIDLRRGTVVLPISQDVLQRGVQLELIHDHPASPSELDSGQSEDRLAYMLQVLYYELE